MILRVILKNFLSFDDEVQFDMFPNMKRTSLPNHILKAANKLPVLKMAAIYGANGAGKSNLVKALEFIQRFVSDKNYIENIEIQNFFHLLNRNSSKEPMYLAIEFASEESFLFYEMKISKTVVSECLSETVPLQNKIKPIFTRKGPNVEIAESEQWEGAILDLIKRWLKLNQWSSLLSLNEELPIIQNKKIKYAANWLKRRLDIIGIHSFMPTLIELLRRENEIMNFVRKFIPRLELEINGVELIKSDFDQWAKDHIKIASSILGNIDKVKSKSMSINANNIPLLSINVEDGMRKVWQLRFANIGKHGYPGNLDASLQSDGTLRALTLLPALYYALRGHTVVIDEINCCLSPTMVKGIVEFFSKSDAKGQLIFTTHEEQLLDERGILRSDEIWFVDKYEGASILYSHNDFKEHHTMSPMRGYKEGRYGAIRFINLPKE